MKILTCLCVAAAMSAGAAHADDRTPTAGERAVIQNFRTVINATLDRLGAASGLQEVDLNHRDIDPDNVVAGTTDTPFVFYGDIARLYESAPADQSARMQALAAQLQTARDSATQQKIIADMQALSTVDATPQRLEIVTSHNVPYFGIEGDDATALDQVPAGACAAFAVRPHSGEGLKAYELEFCDPAAVSYDEASRFYRYRFTHPDGSPHVEHVEIHIEGTPDVVDKLLAGYDWTQVRGALQP